MLNIGPTGAFVKTHGMRQSVEYRAYWNAKSRCEKPNHPAYKNYGARVIKFLFQSFVEFYKTLGAKPHAHLTLERVNNDGHYEAGNVKWTTRREQVLNRRCMKGDLCLL